MASFCNQDNQGKRQIRTLAGGEFTWLVFMHVLPRLFRRWHAFVLLHANAKRLNQLMRLAVRLAVQSLSLFPQCPALKIRSGQ